MKNTNLFRGIHGICLELLKEKRAISLVERIVFGPKEFTLGYKFKTEVVLMWHHYPAMC